MTTSTHPGLYWATTVVQMCDAQFPYPNKFEHHELGADGLPICHSYPCRNPNVTMVPVPGHDVTCGRCHRIHEAMLNRV